MDAGTKVRGFVDTKSLNVRSGAGASFSIAAPSLPNETQFEGEIAKDLNGADWIKLSSVNGVPVTGNQYIAGWYTNHQAVTPPAPQTPPQPKPIVVTSNITENGKLIVTIEEPNGYEVNVHVNGEAYLRQL